MHPGNQCSKPCRKGSVRQNRRSRRKKTKENPTPARAHSVRSNCSFRSLLSSPPNPTFSNSPHMASVRLLNSPQLSLSTSVDALLDDSELAAPLVKGWTPGGRSSRFRKASLYLGTSPSGATRAQSLLDVRAFTSPLLVGAVRPRTSRRGRGRVCTFRRTLTTRTVRAPRRAWGAPGSILCPPRRVPDAGVCEGRVAG
jgi:hypothetical protein